ncbi:S9 family peptidase [Flavihumibacter sp. R14]|nr:S9 family peptidase [Flavihumibacter soli]
MNFFNIRLCFLAIVFCVSCSAEKETRSIPVEDFFKNPEKTAFSISPDGEYISYLQPYHDRLNIFVQTTDGKNVVRLTSDTSQNIAYYFWANNKEILYLRNAGNDSDLGLFAVKKDGTDNRKLIEYQNSKIGLITPKAYNNNILVSLNMRDSTVFDAYRMNITTGKLSLLVRNPGNITEFYADSSGELRLALTSDGVDETLIYRETEKDDFRPVVKNNFKTSINFLGFSKDSCIYILTNKNRDKKALVELNCNTGKEHQELYSNPQVDVSEGSYSRSKNKMVFAGYESWKKERHYLDNDTRDMYERLEELLPDTEIKITDQDSSESKFIIRTFTDRNPGTYYLYNIEDNQLKKLGDINSSIKQNEMAPMKPVSYKSRDGLTINGYLTLPLNMPEKNLPVVVLPHGGPSFRNSWGYNSEVQFLANRGYAVFQMNFRGSTGYGKSFWIAGFKEWGGKIQNDITDGVKWLISKEIADPKRIAIYGASFGGFSALHGLCFNSELYACGASYSGLTNLFTYLKGIPPYYKPYQQMYFEMVGDPEKDADYFRDTSPIFHTDKIKVPVLIAQGTKDPRVNVNETNQFVKELKKRKMPVTYILKENERHFFKKPENRIEFYQQLEKFLDGNLNKN